MRDIKFILRDVVYEFYKHDRDYHHVTDTTLLKEVIEYIDSLPTKCPQCSSGDVEVKVEFFHCHKCGATFN